MSEHQRAFEDIREEIEELIRHTPAEEGEPVVRFVSAIEREESRCSMDSLPRRQSKGSRRLGVFPSSFNPLTVAHVELTRRARETFDLDEVILVLDARAMDKEIHGAPLEDRLLMLRRFALSCSGYRVAFSSHGRFLDKLRALRRIGLELAEVCFIVGYDTILRVLDPKYYDDREAALEELFRGSRFLVANRADGGPAELQALLDRPENRRFKDRVAFFSLPGSQAHISSTLVREKLARGEDACDLVPSAICRFIRKNSLYAPSGRSD